MTEISRIMLRDARPDDRIHLILWDTPNEAQIRLVALHNNAHLVNYRENLLQRINQDEQFIALHHDIKEQILLLTDDLERLQNLETRCQQCDNIFKVTIPEVPQLPSTYGGDRLSLSGELTFQFAYAEAGSTNLASDSIMTIKQIFNSGFNIDEFL